MQVGQGIDGLEKRNLGQASVLKDPGSRPDHRQGRRLQGLPHSPGERPMPEGRCFCLILCP
ncbi:MAG: hypothetical protein MZV70_28115 [Desulfobacterales bacterium]|nr:hypothetical protein [Desulfobacterales bacterium]